MATHIFLVHGVGLPAPDLFGSDLRPRLHEFGIFDFDVNEVDWNEIVELPYVATDTLAAPGRFINFAQIAGLIRGLVGAAALPGPRNFLLCRLTYFLLHCTIVVAPLMALWSFFAVVSQWQSHHSDDDLMRSLSNPIVQIGGTFFGSPVEELSWIPTAYWRAVAILVLAVISVHLAENGAQGALAGIRKCTACLLWAAVYFVALAVSWVGALAAAAYVLAVAVDLIIRWADPVAMTAEGVIVAGASAIQAILRMQPGLLLAIGAAVGVISAAKLFMWFFKVFADVMCFVGDPTYGATLTEYVRKKLGQSKFAAGDNVVIVGHSLGSAICSRSLLEAPPPFPCTVRVSLVTMGSPIKRLLAKFFPGIMPSADSAAIALSARYIGLRWLNVYRPSDPIGGSIFSRRCPSFTRDISAKQYSKQLILAHTGYWDDGVVADIVVSNIRDSSISEQILSQRDDREHDTNALPEKTPWAVSANRLLGTARWFPAVMATGALGLGMANSVFDLMKGSTPSLAGNSAALCSDADLYRYREENPYAVARPELRLPLSRDGYIITFTPAGAARPVVSRADRFAFGRSLVSLFGQRSDSVTIGQRSAFFGRYELPADRVPIKVRYRRDDPAVFDLPAVPASVSRERSILQAVGVWFLLIVPAIFVFIVSFLSFRSISAWISWPITQPEQTAAVFQPRCPQWRVSMMQRLWTLETAVSE